MSDTYLDPAPPLWHVLRAVGGLALMAGSTVLVVIVGYHVAGGIGILAGLLVLSAIIAQFDS